MSRRSPRRGAGKSGGALSPQAGHREISCGVGKLDAASKLKTSHRSPRRSAGKSGGALSPQTGHREISCGVEKLDVASQAQTVPPEATTRRRQIRWGIVPPDMEHLRQARCSPKEVQPKEVPVRKRFQPIQEHPRKRFQPIRKRFQPIQEHLRQARCPETVYPAWFTHLDDLLASGGTYGDQE
jgi:hypothetical protein